LSSEVLEGEERPGVSRDSLIISIRPGVSAFGKESPLRLIGVATRTDGKQPDPLFHNWVLREKNEKYH
jgi:hypothetical protein